MTKFLSPQLMLLLLASCAGASPSQNKIAMNSQTQCLEGTTRQGFLSPTTSGDFSCLTGTQTCVANSWQGPQLFDSCENFTKNCGSSPHGATINGFMAPTAFNDYVLLIFISNHFKRDIIICLFCTKSDTTLF